MNKKSNFLNLVLSIVAVSFLVVPNATHVRADDCKLPGTAHDDNKPSEKKGEKLIDSGASACEVAKQCDAMNVDVAIDSKKQLHETEMYQSAPGDVKKELDEYAEHGSGHDNPNIVCYEVEEAVKGD